MKLSPENKALVDRVWRDEATVFPRSFNRALNRALDEARAEAVEAAQAWAWLAKRTNLELDWAEIAEGEAAWRVHRVNGGRNDREWTLIATGETPLAAIMAARASSNPAGDVEHG